MTNEPTGLENPLLDGGVQDWSPEDDQVNPEEMTFSMVIGQELSTTDEDWGDDRGEWFSSSQVNRGDMTYEELQQFYEEQSMAGHQVFPTFEDYLSYMIRREELIANDPYFIFKKGSEQQAGYQGHYLELLQRQNTGEQLNDGELAVLAAYQAHIDSGEPLLTFDPASNEYFQDWGGIEAGYEAFMNSPEMQALNEEYGIDPFGTWTNEDGDVFMWSGSGMVKVQKNQADFADVIGNVIMGVGVALMSGGVVGGLLPASMSPITAGAIKGALGSAISQGVVNGEISAEAVLQAAIIGGIGGLADQLANMDSAIADGGFLGAADDIVNGVSEILNIPYDEALAILEGLATGAVTGDDLQSIVAAAVGTYGAEKIEQLLRAAYGDTLDIDYIFGEGDSNIPLEAIKPVVEGTITELLSGDLDWDDLPDWVIDYFEEGGDIDFLLPHDVEFGSLGECEQYLPTWLCNIRFPELPGGGPSLGDPCEDENGDPGWFVRVAGSVGEFICNANIRVGDPCYEGEKTGQYVLGPVGELICEGVDLECPDWMRDPETGECLSCEALGLERDPATGECINLPDIECPDWMRDPNTGECLSCEVLGLERDPNTGECIDVNCEDFGLTKDPETGECVSCETLGLERDPETGQCINIDIDCESFGLTRDPETGQCVSCETLGLTRDPETGQCIDIDCESLGLTRDPETGQCVSCETLGLTRDPETGQCIDIDCEDLGLTRDPETGQCVSCETLGLERDPETGQCIDIDCESLGLTKDPETGQCVSCETLGLTRDPETGECINIDINCEDFGLVKDPETGECIEGPEIDCEDFGLTRDPETGECIEGPDIDCESFGLTKDPETGECIEGPDLDCPDWLRDPETGECLPFDMPKPAFRPGAAYDMGPRAQLYEYTPFTPVEAPGPREFEQFLQQARGMLDV